jgi:hypothetical protein
MRDFLYILGLMAAICILAMDFPVAVANACGDSPLRAPFASYVELSPSVHAAYLESAKTSWQVRNGARAHPAIGRLDSGVPLLMEALPAHEKVEFGRIEGSASPVGTVDVGVYSLLPGSEGVDSPRFSAKPQCDMAEDGGNDKAFPKDEMLSVDQFRKLKEIMQ